MGFIIVAENMKIFGKVFLSVVLVAAIVWLFIVGVFGVRFQLDRKISKSLEECAGTLAERYGDCEKMIYPLRSALELTGSRWLYLGVPVVISVIVLRKTVWKNK